MKFHHLLSQREALLRQARLANVAYAYQRLGEFAARIARAGLHGEATLRAGDPSDEQPWPTLQAEECSQPVLEEHFLDEEVIELADIMAFLHDDPDWREVRFRLEDLAGRFLPRLRRELARAAIVPQSGIPTSGERGRRGDVGPAAE